MKRILTYDEEKRPKFVACDAAGKVAYSINGITNWKETTVSSAGRGLRGIRWEDDEYIMFETSTGAYIYRSYNGRTWEQYASPSTTGFIEWLIKFNGYYVIKQNANIYYTDTLGNTWESFSLSSLGTIIALQRSDAIAVDNSIYTINGTRQIIKIEGPLSAPSLSSIETNITVPYPVHKFMKSPEGTILMIGPNNNSTTAGIVRYTNAIATGTIATPAPTSTSRFIDGIYEDNKFVIAPVSTSIWTSLDGTSLTSTVLTGISGTAMNGITYGNNLWVIVGNGGRLVYSFDLESFVLSSMPSTGTWNSVTYGEY